MKSIRFKNILIVVLAVLAVLFSAQAAAEIHFNDPSCKVGDEVTITFTVSESFNSGQIVLIFDSEKLEYVNNSLTSTGLSSAANVSGNSIRIVTSSMDTELHSVSYSFVMRALKAGTAVITVNAAETKLSDGNQQPIASGNHGSSVVTISETETQPPETEPPATNPPETEPPQTEPPHTHEYSVREIMQSNYRTSESEDGTQIIYWDRVRYNCPCGQVFGDPLDEENHREAKPTTHDPSSEARLSALDFDGIGSLSPAFDPDVFSYRLTIDSEVSGLNVRYSTMDENVQDKAYFWPWIDGQMHDGELKTIPYGETVFTVRVTSEDESVTRDYTVIIVRAEPAGQTTEPTTEAPTEPPTSPEESTEVPGSSEAESTPAETVPQTEAPPQTDPEPETVTLSAPAVTLRILPFPAGTERPEGYVLVNVVGAGGVSYQALAPAGETDPDHLILYGVPVRELPPETDENGEALPPAEGEARYEESGEPGLYVYDRRQKTLQRSGLIRVPETSEAEVPSSEETVPATEPASAAPSSAAETQPARQPSESVLPLTTAAPETPAGRTGLPWWLWAVLLALFGICLAVIILLLLSKDRLEKRLHDVERLSSDEEEAFLTMNTDALLNAAKSANPPKRFSADEIEDLDSVFDSIRKGEK